MSQARERLAKLGIHVPEILLPQNKEALNQWSVIACDQFTSEKEYWEQCKAQVGHAPSTLNIILPECYLHEVDQAQETKRINRIMEEYLDSALESQGEGLVFIDRSTPWVKSRKGLVIALDLEAYDFTPGSKTPVRPTEATVVDRLPARIQVRKDAVLDLPHILVLMDDRQDRVMKAAEAAQGKEIYDFELMQKGGHISGKLIEGEEALNVLADQFEALNEESSFLFAIGDGNHSLASAKEIWREMKAQGVEDHPCRYALIELENIHDDGMVFHPIHRILFEADGAKLLQDLEDFFSIQSSVVSGLEEMRSQVEDTSRRALGVLLNGEYRVYELPCADSELTAEAFHRFVDPWLEKNTHKELDYIHGDEAFVELSDQKGNMGFYLSALDKNRFFELVDIKGALPRKTFSIGEAQEKRYYLESRKLK